MTHEEYLRFRKPAKMEVTFVFDHINNLMLVLIRRLGDNIKNTAPKHLFAVLHTYLINNCKPVNTQG